MGGDRVCIKECPRRGWGRFKREDVGVVTHVSSTAVTIDYEYHAGWQIGIEEAETKLFEVNAWRQNVVKRNGASKQREAEQRFEALRCAAERTGGDLSCCDCVFFLF